MYFSDPERANELHSLTDIETFYVSENELEEYDVSDLGWYWWTCLPGCLPDSEPIGPFETELDAIIDVRQDLEWDDIRPYLTSYAITHNGNLRADYILNACKPTDHVIAIVMSYDDISPDQVLDWYNAHKKDNQHFYKAF